MNRSFATWLDIDTSDTQSLKRELDHEMEMLAYDLKVCGPGYPSPRKDSIRRLAAEIERRKQARR